MCGTLAPRAPGAIKLHLAPGSLSLSCLELSWPWSWLAFEFSLCPGRHTHSILPWSRTLCIASSLVLDALVRALNGAHGPSVVESSVGAILESGTKLGRVTVTYILPNLSPHVRVV